MQLPVKNLSGLYLRCCESSNFKFINWSMLEIFYQVHQQIANQIVKSVLCSLTVHTTDDVCTRDKMATVCVEAEA